MVCVFFPCQTLRTKTRGAKKHESRKLTAIIGVRDPHATTDHAPPLEAAVIALVARVHDRAGVNEGIAYDALAVALLAKATDGDAGLLPAHHQIGMMLGHALKKLFIPQVER